MPVTVKENVLPVAVMILAERKSAWPDELVITEALPLTAPLQVPLTVAPDTGFPLPSRTVTEASASVRPRLARRLIAMLPTEVVLNTSKPAVTERADVMLTTQLPVPEQAPDQPVKAEPAVGVAVYVTLVPEA
jgi:hypothetical protein